MPSSCICSFFFLRLRCPSLSCNQQSSSVRWVDLTTVSTCRTRYPGTELGGADALCVACVRLARFQEGEMKRFRGWPGEVDSGEGSRGTRNVSYEVGMAGMHCAKGLRDGRYFR